MLKNTHNRWKKAGRYLGNAHCLLLIASTANQEVIC